MLVLENLEIKDKPDIYLVLLGENVISTGIKLADKIRKETRKSVILEPSRRGMKGQMKEANRKKVKWAILLGENEMESGIVQVKDMITGEQKDVPLDKVVSYFQL